MGRPRKERCPDCLGSGWIVERHEVRPDGSTITILKSGKDGMCPRCGGHGFLNYHPLKHGGWNWKDQANASMERLQKLGVGVGGKRAPERQDVAKPSRVPPAAKADSP